MSAVQVIHFSLAEHAEIGLSFHLAPSIVAGSEIEHKLLLQRTQWNILPHASALRKFCIFVNLSTLCIAFKSRMLSRSVCRCFIMLQTTVFIKKKGRTVFFEWTNVVLTVNFAMNFYI
jgi:hypothetical protein